MKTSLLCILLFSATVSFGQDEPSAVLITPDEDWRILGSNSDNGFTYYYNPDKIWKKSTFFTCYIKLLVDSAHLARFQHRVKRKYGHGIYKLQVSCKQKNIKAVGIEHYDNNGDLITLAQKSNNQFVLNKYVKESILTNVCNSIKVPWFDAKKESPF
jgi:hypothetical protein